MTIEIKIPIRLISEANNTDHWRVKHKRKKKIQALLLTYWPDESIELPCTVTMTRIAPRELDYDNLVYANKALFDSICGKLRPGFLPGRADRTDLIKPIYLQEKGEPKEYSVKIKVSTDP